MPLVVCGIVGELRPVQEHGPQVPDFLLADALLLEESLYRLGALATANLTVCQPAWHLQVLPAQLGDFQAQAR
eukprot:CAMPEP_0180808268 /NCGR_PEP_ID=MMETSP1038_2-20121128/63705_1 /TAXON_ID=632150 /ORGANISM="Azadinium spinosum, Strain 3D9" /LENGTH=72 /DNA_ID=CAMNT_0022849369 /DNA_START=237 /DNA_END=451 /DNA_ORIENTATION=+